jgi:predicted glycosyltransferase
MTREMAVLGIPTISVYQNELLDVDKFLVSADKMLYLPDLKITKVKEFMQSKNAGKLDVELANKGKGTYKLIKKMILEL